MPRSRSLSLPIRSPWPALAAGLLLMLAGQAARAGIIDDPNDFLGTFVGPHNGDLDVRFADATFNPGTGRIVVTGRFNGAVGSTVDPTLGSVLYVFGFNRGTGTPGFAGLGLNDILFDAVVLLSGDGTGSIRLFPEAQAITLDPADITIAGDTIRARFDASLLPGRGLSTRQFTFNLWPRLGLGNNNQVADFAPDTVNAALATVPEPSALTLTSLGVASLVLMRTIIRRRPRRTA
jgi:hypothetical protein